MEHELPEVLDGIDEPVSVEELEDVVRRAGQRRRASLVAGAAGLLLCGGVAGALARGPAEDRTTGVASSGQDVPPPRAAMGVAMDVNGKLPWPLTSVFRREANGVAIRVYRSTPPEGQPGPLAGNGCKAWSTIHGELSNTAAVGFAPAQDLPGDSFLLLNAGKFGQAEGEPVTWATVRTGAGVATARLKLGEATDAMAPQAGIALLAVPGNGGDGFVEGLDAEGKVVATQELKNIAHPPPDPACSPGPPCTIHPSGAGTEPAPAKPVDGAATPLEPKPPTAPGAPEKTPPPTKPDPAGQPVPEAETQVAKACPPLPVPPPAADPALPAPPPAPQNLPPFATGTTMPAAGSPRPPVTAVPAAPAAPAATTSTPSPSATPPPPSPTSTAPVIQAP